MSDEENKYIHEPENEYLPDEEPGPDSHETTIDTTVSDDIASELKEEIVDEDSDFMHTEPEDEKEVAEPSKPQLASSVLLFDRKPSDMTKLVKAFLEAHGDCDG